jgi:hypothetical protein
VSVDITWLDGGLADLKATFQTIVSFVCNAYGCCLYHAPVAHCVPTHTPTGLHVTRECCLQPGGKLDPELSLGCGSEAAPPCNSNLALTWGGALTQTQLTNRVSSGLTD